MPKPKPSEVLARHAEAAGLTVARLLEAVDTVRQAAVVLAAESRRLAKLERKAVKR